MKTVIFIQLLAYVYISHAEMPYTDDPMVRLAYDMFESLDADEDDVISRTEVTLFTFSADHNSNGCISLAEFQLTTSATAEIAENIFIALNNGNWSSCMDVYSFVCQLDTHDLNMNGYTELDEFVNWYLDVTRGRPYGQ